MNGKIFLKEWIARLKRNSVKLSNLKRSFAFGHHTGDKL
jgi:hypothetical protein